MAEREVDSALRIQRRYQGQPRAHHSIGDRTRGFGRAPHATGVICLSNPGLVDIDDASAVNHGFQHLERILLAKDEATLGIGLDRNLLDPAPTKMQIYPQLLTNTRK